MKKTFQGLGLFLLFLLVAVPVGIWGFLWTSTPQHKPEHSIKTLKSPVSVDIDWKGVPSIQAENLPDLFTVQGYIVARDRLFQMDLLRRQSAGRLAEIVGSRALSMDKQMRSYGLAEVAKNAGRLMDPENLRNLQSYADGVNSFIDDKVYPWETKLLGYVPEPWKPEDTILVALNLYNTLNHPSNEVEFVWEGLFANRPKALVDFLTPEFGFFDAPILKDTKIPVLPPPPPKEVFNVRTQAAISVPFPMHEAPELPGSNAWAVGPKKTKTGSAMLSGDPHIRHSVPNIWYRQELKAKDFYAVGVSFPGIPGIVIGTNSFTAWTFTTPAVDNVDFVPLKIGKTPDTYLAYGKEEKFAIRPETYKIRKQEPVSEEVRETVWGPVREFNGKLYALQWSGRDPEVLKDLEVVKLNQSKSVKEAFVAISRWAGPPQNFFVADKEGHIGWVLAGKIPKKIGMDGRVPMVRDAAHDWKGYYAFHEQPQVIDPPEGFIASGNQRQVPVNQDMYKWGSDWPLPARAYRIEERLKAEDGWDITKMAALQNDVYSHTHVWYRDKLIESIATEKSKVGDANWLNGVETLVMSFDGNLHVDSAAYPFLKRFRFEVMSELIGPLVKGVVPDELDEDLKSLLQKDMAIKGMLELKPMHLLSSKYENFDAVLVQAALKVAKEMVSDPSELKKLRWGNVNHAEVRHPLSSALPKVFGRFLNMPESELSGDSLVPRVNRPNHGASMRMNIDLSDLKKSVYNHPGGQSGHVLSKNYSDEFKDWVDGKPQTFLTEQIETREKFLP